MSRRSTPPIAGIAALLLLWTALWWSVPGWLLAPVLPGGWLTILLAAAIALIPLPVLLRGFTGGGYPSAATRLLLFRPFWYVQLALPLLAMAGALGVLAGLAWGQPREFGRWAVAAAGLLFVVLGVRGYAGTRRLAVRRLPLKPAGLPPGFAGCRIVQLSDLHVGPHTSARHIERVAEAVRRLAPDLIVHTGDQVDDYARDMETFARYFGDLEAPLGVYAIAGNHDVLAGWAGVRSALERLGITVLVNEAVAVERGGTRVWLVGTGDPAGEYWDRGGGDAAAPDLDRSLRGVPTDGFTIALAHNPALWPGLAARGVSLTLSGHTHYGQLSIPSLGWCLASPFLEHAMGLHRRGDAILYISPGTNFWGIPFRVGIPAEVTVVELEAPGGGA